MIPMFVEVASTVAAIVAPFTPYLVEGGKAFAEKAGEAAWNKAQKIWTFLASKFGDDPAIKGSALVLSANPEDESLQALLAKALARKLETNQELTEQLMELVGGQKAMQDMLIDKSWVGDVVQELTGSGTQTATITDSSVRSVKQRIN
jgi:hypothetical protein